MALKFTPQQLTGFGGYKSRTLIGNWSEDVQLQEEKLRQWVAASENSSLYSQKIQGKVNSHTRPVELTPLQDDGLLHFGDRVMIQCADTSGFLSLDLDDKQKIVGQPLKYFPTTVPGHQPLARSIWTIEKVGGPDDGLYPPGEEDVLHYNQPFKIVFPKGLRPEGDLYLYSELMTGTIYSKVSHKQQVAAVDHATSGLIWRAMSVDLEYRMEMEGQPIKANCAVVLNHSQTNAPLYCSVKYLYPNDFGKEYEVSCYGDRGIGTKMKCLPEQPTNHFAFITGPPQEGSAAHKAGFSMAPPPSELEAARALAAVREKLLYRGGNSFRGLSRILRILDDNGDRTLDRYELSHGLETYGIHLNEQELGIVMRHFDTNGDGKITVTELMRAIRGPMKPFRLDLVRAAFSLLDKDESGVVSFAELRSLYDVRRHPEVLDKSKTPDQVLHEFTKGWDTDGDGDITWQEFCDYYEDISAGINDDNYFEIMMRNAWHISGGKGPRANQSCRKVLVTHTDGSQTIEEIINDLRIAHDDIPAMKQNLIQQGITDIKKIQIYS